MDVVVADKRFEKGRRLQPLAMLRVPYIGRDAKEALEGLIERVEG